MPLNQHSGSCWDRPWDDHLRLPVSGLSVWRCLSCGGDDRRSSDGGMTGHTQELLSLTYRQLWYYGKSAPLMIIRHFCNFTMIKINKLRFFVGRKLWEDCTVSVCGKFSSFWSSSWDCLLPPPPLFFLLTPPECLAFTSESILWLSSRGQEMTDYSPLHSSPPRLCLLSSLSPSYTLVGDFCPIKRTLRFEHN